MTKSVYAPNSFLNILKGTGQAARDKAGEAGPWLLLSVLCVFLGFLGVHRFAVKRWGTGVLYLLTLGFLGIGVLVDLVALLEGHFKDSQGHCIPPGLSALQRWAVFSLVLIGLQWVLLHHTGIPLVNQGVLWVQAQFRGFLDTLGFPGFQGGSSAGALSAWLDRFLQSLQETLQ